MTAVEPRCGPWRGERASGHADALLIMDDRAGRAEARSRGITVVGTAAVIGMAFLKGQIPLARPVLEDLVQAGYFISQPIIEAVLADIGETTDQAKGSEGR